MKSIKRGTSFTINVCKNMDPFENISSVPFVHDFVIDIKLQVFFAHKIISMV